MPEEMVLVEATGTRQGVGQLFFNKTEGYKYPVTLMEKEKAQRMVRSEERDGTNNFRIAVPVAYSAPLQEDDKDALIVGPDILMVAPEDEPVEPTEAEQPKSKGRPPKKAGG